MINSSFYSKGKSSFYSKGKLSFYNSSFLSIVMLFLFLQTNLYENSDPLSTSETTDKLPPRHKAILLEIVNPPFLEVKILSISCIPTPSSVTLSVTST